MIALVMAGGRGTRLGGVCKPMLEVCGEPMIARIISAVRSFVECIVLAISGWTRRCLEDLCRDPLVECIETSGRGYVEDLATMLSSLRKPLLVLPSDTPLLREEHIETLLLEAQRAERACVVTLEGPRGPVGISLFRCEGGSWASIRIDDPLLVNVNTVGDLELVERLCIEGSRG